MLEGESFISLALAWSAFLQASDWSRPSILASDWSHCSPFSGANQADSPQSGDNSGVQVMTGSIVHCLHTTQFLFTIRQISTMRLHCQSQTTFREQRPSLTKSVMNCPHTQASLHNAEETFILDFQRHPSQCDGGQRQVSPILHHQFYHFFQELDPRGDVRDLKLSIQTKWSETPRAIVPVSEQTPGILTCLGPRKLMSGIIIMPDIFRMEQHHE